MTKTTGSTVGKLKEIIDKNGPNYLTDEPYQVYNEDFRCTWQGFSV